MNVLYCTNVGDVEGIINIYDSLLTFIPITVPSSSLENNKFSNAKENSENRYGKFSASIDVRDIDECNVMAVPHPDCEEIYEMTKEYVVDHLLQIILKHHGER